MLSKTDTHRLTGRNAASRKYDLLTALGAYALARDKHAQRLVLRFMTLITARYNWARDELTCGQREIAQMWSVDARTVKREMAKLRAQGWLVVRRQGARGRVTQYAIDIDKVLTDTQPQWAAVGPDFALRMTPQEPAANVVPFTGQVAAPDISGGSEWALAQALLHAEDAALYGAWIAGLTRRSRAGGQLLLAAPSRFHASYVTTHLMRRIATAVEEVDSDISDIRITAD